MSSPGLDSPASWRVLGGGGLAFAFGVPALFGSTFGLFMVPLQQSQGWTRAEIAFSLTLTTLLSWFAIPLGGWMIDHLRLRPLLPAGVVLGAANLAAFSLIGPNIWGFYALVVALAFTTIGASPLALAKMVQGWFDRRLGIALGVLFACGAVGGVIHPAILQSVITGSGWRQAFVVMGGMALVGGLVAVLFVRERVPGAAAQAARAASAQAGGNAKAVRSVMLAFLRDRTWWMLALWNFLFAFGGGCILVHLAALLTDRGATPAQIGGAMSLLGAGHLAGNLIAGALVDRLNPRRLAWLLMLMPLAATLVLLAAPAIAVMVVVAVAFGLSSGSDGSLRAFLARHYFGSARYGQASATQMVATGIAGGVAPWVSGLLHDRSGSYTWSLVIAAVAFAAAVVAGWALPASGYVEAAASPADEPAQAGAAPSGAAAA